MKFINYLLGTIFILASLTTFGFVAWFTYKHFTLPNSQQGHDHYSDLGFVFFGFSVILFVLGCVILADESEDKQVSLDK